MSAGLAAMRTAKAFIVALLLGWATTAFADVAIPELTGRVVDQTGTLSSGDIAMLTQTLKDLETRKGSQVAVLIVPTTQPETIEQFSIRVAEAWKIGRRKIDDGALLVVAKDDHRLRIEVGYGLEGALTDVTARRIIDEDITPRFRTRDFAGGINAGVKRMIAVIDGEPLPAPKPEASHGPDLDWFGTVVQFWPFILLGPILVGAAFRAMFGTLMGSLTAGGVVGVIAWTLAGSFALGLLLGAIAFAIVLLTAGINVGMPVARHPNRGGYVGGAWSSGGSSSSDWGSSSSGSSDSGGFSGGGGDFGGGGSSGSW